MKSAMQQRFLSATTAVLFVFGLPADAALMSIDVQGIVDSADGDTTLLPFPASPGQLMRVRYTSSVESPGDLSGGDPTTGLYFGALSSMVLTVGDRSYDITNPFAASSRVQIHDNLTLDGGIHFRDGYFAQYANPGAQPADLDADVQLWADTLSPGDALTSDAYLSSPPPLGLFPTAVMNFYGRSESQPGVFGVVRGHITSISAVTVPVPEPSLVWLLLCGLAALAAASLRGRRRQSAAMN
jgi:hypothetical protein